MRKYPYDTVCIFITFNYSYNLFYARHETSQKTPLKCGQDYVETYYLFRPFNAAVRIREKGIRINKLQQS